MDESYVIDAQADADEQGLEDQSDAASSSAEEEDDGKVEANTCPARRPSMTPVRYFNEATPTRREPNSLSKVQHVCFLCGSSQHQSSQCPSDVCLLCLGRGHRTRECGEGAVGWVPPTDPRLQRRIAVCSACGKVGHQHAHCTERRLAPPDISRCRCIACGEPGHLDCTPYEQRPRRESCWNCGAGNHTAEDCNCEGMDRWHRLFASALGSGGGGYGGSSGGSGGSFGGKGSSANGFRAGGKGNGRGFTSSVVGRAPGHGGSKTGGTHGGSSARWQQEEMAKGRHGGRVVTIDRSSGGGGGGGGRWGQAGGPEKTIDKKKGKWAHKAPHANKRNGQTHKRF